MRRVIVCGLPRGRISRPKRLAVRFDGGGTVESINIGPKVSRRDPGSETRGRGRGNYRAAYRGERGEAAGGYNCGGGRLLRRFFLVAAMLFVVCGSFSVQADSCPLFIPALSVGYYNSYNFVGYHSSEYYPVGAPGPYSYEERNFFVFDVPPLTQSVVSAELWISGAYNRLDEDSEVYELNEVTNSAQTVLQEG